MPSLPPTPRPPRRSEQLPPPAAQPSRCSRRLRGEAEGPERIYIASHPDYARCCTSMVTDRTKSKDFIHANKAQIACTPRTKQPPRIDKLSWKRKEYRARLVSAKSIEVNEKLGAMDWEVPDANTLMSDDLTKFVHFSMQTVVLMAQLKL